MEVLVQLHCAAVTVDRLWNDLSGVRLILREIVASWEAMGASPLVCPSFGGELVDALAERMLRRFARQFDCSRLPGWCHCLARRMKGTPALLSGRWRRAGGPQVCEYR
jgi:hypothetical protein